MNTYILKSPVAIFMSQKQRLECYLWKLGLNSLSLYFLILWNILKPSYSYMNLEKNFLVFHEKEKEKITLTKDVKSEVWA